jgi:hypothetical protein
VADRQNYGQLSPDGNVKRVIAIEPGVYPEAVGCQLTSPLLQSLNVMVILPHTAGATCAASKCGGNAFDKDYVARIEGSVNARNPLGLRLGDPRRIEFRVKAIF